MNRPTTTSVPLIYLDPLGIRDNTLSLAVCLGKKVRECQVQLTQTIIAGLNYDDQSSLLKSVEPGAVTETLGDLHLAVISGVLYQLTEESMKESSQMILAMKRTADRLRKATTEPECRSSFIDSSSANSHFTFSFSPSSCQPQETRSKLRSCDRSEGLDEN